MYFIEIRIGSVTLRVFNIFKKKSSQSIMPTIIIGIENWKRV